MTSGSGAGPRGRAQQALAQGDVASALQICRHALRRVRDGSRIDSCATISPAEASTLPSIEQIFSVEDRMVESSAVLIEGLKQYSHWSLPYAPPAIRLLRLRRCTVFWPNVIVSEEGLLLDDNAGFRTSALCDHAPPDFPGLIAGSGHVLLRMPGAAAAPVREPAFFLNASRNYAAWLFADLPRLLARPKAGPGRVLLHGEALDFHAQSLRAVGIGAGEVLPAAQDAPLKCEELYYCTSTYMDHAPSASGIAWLRQRLAALEPPAEPAARRVYLSRENVPASRPLLNERQLAAYLRARAFDVVAPEALSFREQVGAVSGAEAVGGPYGANLANGMFPHRARGALIIATKEQPEISRMFSVLGVPHAHACAERIRIRNAPTFSASYGFRVDLGQVGRCLEALGIS